MALQYYTRRPNQLDSSQLSEQSIDYENGSGLLHVALPLIGIEKAARRGRKEGRREERKEEREGGQGFTPDFDEYPSFSVQSSLEERKQHLRV